VHPSCQTLGVSILITGAEMETFRTMVFLGGQGTPQFIETIWHEGHWWLVATWLQHHATGDRIPERIIQMDGVLVRFQEVQDEPYRFLANNSIPISVFDGVPQAGYTISIHPSAIARTRGPSSIH
jgi:hypothetical protein